MKPTDPLPHPPDWTVSTVGCEVEIRRGVSWSKGQETTEAKDYTVPVLRISNIQARLELDDILHLAGVPEKARRMKKASKHWSVIVGSNGNRNRIGNAVFINEETEFLFASFLIAAKPKEDSALLPEFFFRWLNAYEIQARISASAEGSTGLSNLSHDFLKAMAVAFPQPDEQGAIAHILDAVDAAIERTRIASDKAERLETGLLENLVTKRVNTWRTQRLDAVAEVGSGVTLGRDLSGSPTVSHPYLRVENVQAGFIDLKEIKQVSVRPDEVERYLLRAGDVLMTEGGDFDKLGRGAVWRGSISPCLHQNHVFRVRPIAGVLDSDFLEAVIGSSYGRRFFQTIAKRTTNLASINKTQLRGLRVPCPPMAKQEQIAAVLQAANARVGTIKCKVAALERLKRGLMQDLLTGKVRVPQRN